MKRISCMYLDKKQQLETFADLSENNDYITETAGFVPLEVKFKKFEEAGIAAQFSQSEFTSSDLREAYLSPDFEVTPEDDFEEIQEKVAARQEFFNKIKKSVSYGKDEKAGTDEPIEKKAPEMVEEVKPE